MPGDEALARVAALAEPTRRAIYGFVAASGGDVSRDEVAEAVSVSRKLAAFHLERLLDAGLLETSYQRLGGRTGPGAGRPSKLYRRARTETSVTLPERDYELVARILLAAQPDAAAVNRAARELGRAAGTEARESGLLATLTAHGYEPRVHADEVRLRNCPFDALARDHRSLVCDLNLQLLKGVVEAAGAPETPILDPRPGWCCVALRRLS